MEVFALTHRRLGPDALRALAQDILPALTTHWIGEVEHRAGLAALVAALPTGVSFVDHVSFEVMRELGVSRAFAFDEDFQTAGFETIPWGQGQYLPLCAAVRVITR